MRMSKNVVLAAMICGGVPWAIILGAGQSPLSRMKTEHAGLHNVIRVTDKLFSGSSPEGDVGFASLKKLGIKTIISVDGARPDIERARKRGMRYVHLPIGYNGVPEAQGLRIARAIRDLPGPVYIHCHHGKHRGPAAAAVARICLDEQCTIESALDFMKLAGTDNRYAGLFESVRSMNMKRPTQAELDKVPPDFVEAAKVSALAQSMVEIDEYWEHLKLVKKAGWKVPVDHPDIDPPHVASILGQHYRDAAKTAAARKELSQWLADAGSNAQELEQHLRHIKAGGKAEPNKMEKAFSRMSIDCSRCHEKFRDTAPRKSAP